MSQSLVGSRYDLHVVRAKPAEQDYFAIHAGDIEESADGADLTGYIHSWEVGTTVDGPGIRLVAFLTGCFLRCQYCHNPDTWHKHNGRPVTVSRAMREVSKYAQVLKMSKGGITLSGGEPMVQREFMMEIFRRSKKLGLHTCVDTSGRLGERLSDDDLMQIDLNLLERRHANDLVLTVRGHEMPSVAFAAENLERLQVRIDEPRVADAFAGVDR